MSLQGSLTQKIEIKLYFREIKSASGFIKTVYLTDEEAKAKEEENKKKLAAGEKVEAKDEVLCLTTYWKQLNWAENNEITEKSTYFNQEAGYQDVSIYKYRDLRIKRCLIGWDLKDDNGRDIPFSEDAVDSLPPKAIVSLVGKYDDLTNVSDDDKKK